MNDSKITYRLKNSRPVDMALYGRALTAFAEEFRELAVTEYEDHAVDGVSLHITSVRDTSLLAEAAAMATYALPVVAVVAGIAPYIDYLQSRFRWLKGEGQKPRSKITRETLQNVTAIVSPAVSDAGADLYIYESVSGTPRKDISLSHDDSTAIWHGAKRELALMSQRKGGVHERVVMHWYQARYDARSRHGDRALIESIHPGAVRTIFANDSVKAKMISGNRNPFKMAFLVDVVVETIEDRPVLYRIIDVFGPVRSP